MSQRSGRSLHKLGGDACAADVRPPAGIDSYELAEIAVDMSISAWKPTRAVRKRTVLLDKRTTTSEPGVCAMGDMLFDEQESTPGSQDVDMLDGNVHDSDFTGGDAMLLDEIDGHGLALGVPRALQLPIRARQPIMRVGQPMDVGEGVHMTPEGLCELADAVIRSLICKKPMKLAKGIAVKDSAIHKRLSELAPALFSPGYLQVCGIQILDGDHA